MGPLVPDIITDNLNLIIGLFLGVAFGFVLEQAGFSSSRKLTGLFYGTDFTVLRVFFTAGITAMAGVILLGSFGLLDLDIISINPTFLYAALAGGAIMGVGFVVGGYCPGTSFCGAAIGKIDAMVFIAGGYLGVLLFGEMFPTVQNFYMSAALGDITFNSVLGISPGLFAMILIAAAVLAFAVTTRIELRVNPGSPARSFPVRYHRLAAAGVLAVGIVLAVLPDYKTRLISRAASASYDSAHPVPLISSDELAFRIIDHDPNIRIIDVRSKTDSTKMSLPGAVAIPVMSMFGKEWRDVLAQAHIKKIFVADGESEEKSAAHLAVLLGYENVLILREGLDDFAASVMHPGPPASAGARGDQDVYRFRQKASAQIAVMIREQKAPKATEHIVKRIVGGCGA